MKYNRKIPTVKEMLELLRRGKVSIPPLSFRFLKDQPDEGGNRRFDAMVEASWQGKIARFEVVCKALSTPKAFQEGLNMLKSSPLPKGRWPMLLVPFLSEGQLQELEREGISGIDLCGNGVVIVPGKFAIFRNGVKNRFPSSAPIKNIYRKNSSMVGRVFLLNPIYESVQKICPEVNRRNPLVNRWNKKPMSLSTVSKSLKTLEEDLIIVRNGAIRLTQPDKLFEKLDQNYDPPTVKERIRLKISEDGGMIRELLVDLSQAINLPLVATGLSSVAQYAVMQRGDLLSVYCPCLEPLLERLPDTQTDRFPNLELIETENEPIYFDARQEGNFWWASPVQVCFELMSGDKRDQETAERLKSFLLKDTGSVQL